jgi:hypothetical protein
MNSIILNVACIKRAELHLSIDLLYLKRFVNVTTALF